MRTVLVNPFTASNPRRRSGGGTIVVARANARRPAAPRPTVVVVKQGGGGTRRRAAANPLRRRRRRNANPLITANPLILPNRRGRRRRRNPSFSFQGWAETAFYGVLSGGGVYLANKFMISKLGVDANNRDTQHGVWIRQIARLIAGGAAAYFWPNQIGAAINGAMMYPLASEFDQWWQRQSRTTTTGTQTGQAATLNADLEADLNDVLDGLHYN